MKRKPLLISGTVLAAAWMVGGLAFGQVSEKQKRPEAIHPDVNTSVGGSQTERTDESGVPLPKGSSESGTVEKGKSSGMGSGQTKSSKTENETIHPPLNSSQGGSRSERTGSGVPLPKGSPESGTVEKGKSGASN
jgi:hypothetical protein